ncbi:MAG: M4 family metallopeptidase [Bacteroidota bacterium]
MKTKLPLTLLAGIILLMHVQLHAQTTPKLQDPSNSFIANKALDIDAGGGVIYFKDHELLQGQLFTQYFSSTGLSIYDSMHLVETTHDSILADESSPVPNLAHNLYQQYYKGIPVEGALYTEHYEAVDGNVLSTGGFVVENLNLSVTPQVSESEAFNFAKTHLNAETYSWDSNGIYPIGELMIAKSTVENAIVYKLTWVFRIKALNPYFDNNVYIDATDGSLIKEISNIHTGDFNHLYYGMKGDLDTHRKPGNWFTSDKWFLHANDETRNILTQDNDNSSSTYYHSITDYYSQPWNWDDMTYSDGDDHWGNDHWSATAAHYCASKSWDFYKKTALNRNGMTGWGKHVRVIADWKNDAAAYTQQDNEDHIFIGRYNNHYLATYDIVGHEFTHGVVRNSKPLPNEKISGAIGESFGDIFGFMVERYMFGYVRNWTIGEDAGYTIRNLQSPNVYNHPFYYLDVNTWSPVVNCTPSRSNDNCGIHINCGVQNKWFYLLSMGGSQLIYINNTLQPARTVSGIGIDKAARIAYYAMTNFINYNASNTTFDAVRASTINAAKILYGYCSNEYIQTCRAWYAVNVGTSCDPCLIVPNWYSRNFPYQQPIDLMGTGLAERENHVAKMKVFPNPASNKIKVMVEEINADLSNNNYTINILTVDGKLVFTNTYNTIENVEINVEDLVDGVYFITVTNSNWTKNSKFVKQ